MEPLYTLKGSQIWYPKFGIGKLIGGKIYIYKDYALDIIPTDMLWNALDTLYNKYPDFKYNCICYDFKTPNIIRFDEAKNFDTEREPVVGNMRTVNIKDFKNIDIKCSYSNQIWHHKWLWVDPDEYKDFDIEESFNWSKLWLSRLNEPASGSQAKWQEQLKSINLF